MLSSQSKASKKTQFLKNNFGFLFRVCLERVRRTDPGPNEYTGSFSTRAEFHGPTLAKRTRNTRSA